jgi:hypothetical protein
MAEGIKPMTEPIKCNLSGNALDYLLLAGQMAQEGTPRMLKHAVATLADGVELLLKARLEVYDWSLLFKNVDDADRSKFERGDFQSVTWDQVIKRLKGICGVELPEKHLPVLNALRTLRNQIRHLAVDTDKAKVVSLLVKAYGFAVDFTAHHLEEHLDGEAKDMLAELRRLLGEFQDFVRARTKQIKPTLEKQTYSLHVECPYCLQETLYPEEGQASCAFCGYRADGEAVAEDWIEQHFGHHALKERMIAEDVVQGCPECGAWAAIPIRTEEERGILCLSCGEMSRLGKCELCGEPTYRALCDRCQHMPEKDD